MKLLTAVTFSIFTLQCLTWWQVPLFFLQNSMVVDAFGVEYGPWRSRWTSGINKGHRALIYGEHGMTLEKEEECIDSSSSAFSSLRDTLADQLDNSAQLIRVACAFAPSPHNNLHPKQIQSATIVDVDSTEVQVALAIPQDGMDSGTCVQILVPIPMSCSNTNGNILECIRETMEQMDAYANQLIGQREMVEDRVEQMAQQESIRKELQEENVDLLPDWWTFAELKITLAEECDSLKGLLNEYEFASSLKRLCQIHSPQSASISQIWEAKVASVGPSGLFLRAYATIGQGEDSRCQIVDVPIRFAQTGSTSDDVRDYVLDLVESVETLPEQETPSSAAIVVPAVAAVPAETKVHVDDVLDESVDEKARAIAKARKQPKSPEEEALLAAKYAAIADVSERAYVILKDLGMI